MKMRNLRLDRVTSAPSAGKTRRPAEGRQRSFGNNQRETLVSALLAFSKLHKRLHTYRTLEHLQGGLNGNQDFCRAL
jgi:hypothetical protein